MAELNFIVDQAALQTVQETKLTANFAEMEAALTEFVAPYEKLIVSEDAISTAKADRAKLRSVASHIDAYRKSVKAIYSTPLKEFEEKCKRLTGIIDKGVTNLDAQVKEFEQKKKEEKLFLLHDYFDNQRMGMNHPEYISWEQIENQKWGNVTYSVDTAHKDIDLACMQTDKDVQDIINLSSEFQLSLLDEYKKHHDIFAVFQMQERLAAQKLREKQKQAELEAQYREAKAKKAADQIKNQSNPKPAEEPKEQMFVAVYRIYGSYETIMTAQQLMNTYEIPYAFDGMAKTDKPVEAALA